MSYPGNFCLAFFLVLTACTHVPTPQEQFAAVEAGTGLRPVSYNGGNKALLEKVHRGYPVIMKFEMGEVWGRYGARLAMGELGKELGGIASVLTGGYRHIGPHPVGSPLDRLLSSVIGQPLSIAAVLVHHRPSAPRLDVLSDFSTIAPDDRQPDVGRVNFAAGHIYSADREFGERLLSDPQLMNLLKNFRSQYIRVDGEAVTFMFAGSENEYSGMLRNFGGYDKFLNGILDSLALIADRI